VDNLLHLEDLVTEITDEEKKLRKQLEKLYKDNKLRPWASEEKLYIESELTTLKNYKTMVHNLITEGGKC
jgi:hypothetical protein